MFLPAQVRRTGRSRAVPGSSELMLRLWKAASPSVSGAVGWRAAARPSAGGAGETERLQGRWLLSPGPRSTWASQSQPLLRGVPVYSTVLFLCH